MHLQSGGFRGTLPARSFAVVANCVRRLLGYDVRMQPRKAHAPPPDEWRRLATGDTCPACRADLFAGDPRVLLELPSGRVLLQNDGDFPGYCILWFRRHAAELFDLTPPERAALVEDLNHLAQAIWHCCKPAKLNYVCLGNEVPHLHWHIIPRYADDGWWGKSPFVRPAEQTRTLTPELYADLAAALRKQLAR